MSKKILLIRPNNSPLAKENEIYTMGRELETVNLMITAQCNINCPCCYQYKSNQELSTQQIFRLLEELATMKVKTLMISGGEPLLRDDLFQILQLCKQNDIRVSIGTNGTLITPQIAAKLKETNVSSVCVGIDGYNKEGFADKDRKAFENTIRGITALRQAKIPTVANLIVTHKNVRYLKKTLKYITSLGVKQVNVIRPKPSVNPDWFEATRLTPEDIYKLQRDSIRLFNKFNLDRVHIDCSLGSIYYGLPEEFFQEEKILTCSAGIDFCAVTNQGDVYPCPDLKQKAFWAGNISNQPLGDIWQNSPVFQRFRTLVDIKGFCGKCKIRNYCRGCRAIALYDTQDAFGQDKDCPYGEARAWKKVAMLIPIYSLLLLTYLRDRLERRGKFTHE